jgi:hypothetical protein
MDAARDADQVGEERGRRPQQPQHLPGQPGIAGQRKDDLRQQPLVPEQRPPGAIIGREQVSPDSQCWVTECASSSALSSACAIPPLTPGRLIGKPLHA